MLVADARNARVEPANLNSSVHVRKQRQREREREELDSLLPWGLGAVIETFANTLDDIIGDAMDEWNMTPEKKANVEAPRRRTTGEAEETEAVDGTTTSWSMTWNDVFGETESEAEEDDERMQPSPTSTSTIEGKATEPRHVADIDVNGRVELDALQKELRRSKKQNSYLKKKISALQEQLEGVHRQDTAPTTDELVMLRMQIEHLLAQKSKLGYENDSLRRENERLNELVDYFLGGEATFDLELDDEDSCTSSISID